ncbi:YlbL family protein [Microlunatus speluncae]|uniref:YlbL family protein n=1 Tax=Microlunatus speluncae TaxID=2594267 RepID=UPI00126612D1|nr:S16 family serine protease [Microlunatus speluncae]
MTRQTWTAFFSAAVFIALTALLVFVPAPYVSWSPGGTQDTLGTINDVPIISIKDTPTFPTSGRLDLTTVSVSRADSRVSLPEAVLSYWLPGRDALPRTSVYPEGTSAVEAEQQQTISMQTAQHDAVVAALQAAGEKVTAMPVVSSVVVDGPAHDKLRPGDLIISVDGQGVHAVEDPGTLIRKRPVGYRVPFVVLRDHRRVTVEIATIKSDTDPRVPVVGITVGMGYSYGPDISFDLGDRIGGPSAGLVFALAIYDKITPGELLAGRHIAGTGTISPDGTVGPIGGLQEKITAADSAGAEAFLVPAPNCGELAGLDTDLELIKVTTLADGIESLGNLDAPDRLPRCG